MGEQVETLENETDFPVADRRLFHIGQSADLDLFEEVLSSGRHVEHPEDVEQRRLAGAGSPDETDEFAAAHGGVDALQHRNLKVSGEIGFADIDQPDDVFRERIPAVRRHFFESCFFWYGR
ncbi:hypothetical protein SDC9_134448 [bioreactor metagenome]|uniref:Uncharacterized protein n=1 Tax=bioreactor metagenome TaxID=1076179 RepID=A0A645DFJ6_9ZZZZ